jgi:hypothetical protein
MLARVAGVAVAVVVGACASRGAMHARASAHASVHHSTISGSRSVSTRGGDGSTMTTGLITLGAAYVGTVVGGQIAQASFDAVAKSIDANDSVSDLWIPVVGPWLGLEHNEDVVRKRCEEFTPTPGIGGSCNTGVVTAASIGMAVGGVAQAVGLAITVVGATKYFLGRRGGVGVAVVPTATPAGGGLAVVGRF